MKGFRNAVVTCVGPPLQACGDAIQHRGLLPKISASPQRLLIHNGLAGPSADAYHRFVPDLVPPKFDPIRVRADFPTLAVPSREGRPVVYLDNGATTQKPHVVIDAVSDFYRHHNANIHRAVHQLSQSATDAFEHARIKVQRFLNAPAKEEVLFTRGTTESINLVANGIATALATRPGDEILLSTLEHHSNIVPWQMAAQRHGLTIKVIPIDDHGELDYAALPTLVSAKTKLIAITHTSNALGTIIDLSRIVAEARRVGAAVLVDGAQRVGHHSVDVRALGVDFYAFSSHKLFGPTGVGVLWGRCELLERLPPYQGGGDMIRTVSFEGTTYADLPNKFEAGTPDIAGVIGLGVAIDYVQSLDRAAVAAHEHDLLTYATDRLRSIDGLRIVGSAPHKTSIVSFVLESPAIDPHTLGTLLDGEGIAVRTGHHCCMPLMNRLGVGGTVRASFAFYNTRDDVDRLHDALIKIRQSFAVPGTIDLHTAVAGPNDPIPWAPPAAASPDEAAATLIEDFDLFDDWTGKNEYLLDLSKKVRALPDAAKTEATRVHGCQSTVHLVGRLKPNTRDVIEFAAQSDAFIVNGLIYLLTTLFSGQRADAVLGFDIESFFERLGLNQHLSMGRRNGLAGMASRIRKLAAAHASPAAIDKLKAGVTS